MLTDVCEEIALPHTRATQDIHKILHWLNAGQIILLFYSNLFHRFEIFLYYHIWFMQQTEILQFGKTQQLHYMWSCASKQCLSLSCLSSCPCYLLHTLSCRQIHTFTHTLAPFSTPPPSHQAPFLLFSQLVWAPNCWGCFPFNQCVKLRIEKSFIWE